MRLKKFKKYWEEKHRQMSQIQNIQKQPSGVMCPTKGCKNELWVDNSMILPTFPPKRRSGCDKCGWSGYL